MPAVTFEDFTPRVRVPLDNSVLQIVEKLNKERERQAHFTLETEKDQKKTVRMLRRCAEELDVTVRIVKDDDSFDIWVTVRDRQKRPGAGRKAAS